MKTRTKLKLAPGLAAEGGTHGKWSPFLLGALVTLTGVVSYLAPASGHADGDAGPIAVIEIPPGYRDWRLISVAHEEGDLHSFAAVLGNDVAIKAYRDTELPFPDGTSIAALHYHHIPSEENNKVFGRDQSFVAGEPSNVQFMIKDSNKYASTGGWGFGHFQSGKPLTDKVKLKGCFPATSLPKLGTLSSPITHLETETKTIEPTEIQV